MQQTLFTLKCLFTCEAVTDFQWNHSTSTRSIFIWSPRLVMACLLANLTIIILVRRHSPHIGMWHCSVIGLKSNTIHTASSVVCSAAVPNCSKKTVDVEVLIVYFWWVNVKQLWEIANRYHRLFSTRENLIMGIIPWQLICSNWQQPQEICGLILSRLPNFDLSNKSFSVNLCLIQLHSKSCRNISLVL